MPETTESLCRHLRRMADGPLDAIDAERLCRAADEIERLRKALSVIAEYLPAFDYAGRDEYGHWSPSSPGSPYDQGRHQEAAHLSGIARKALTQ